VVTLNTYIFASPYSPCTEHDLSYPQNAWSDVHFSNEFWKAHYAKLSSSQSSDWPIFHRAYITLLKFTPFVGPSIISNAPTVWLWICHVNTHNPYNRHSTPLFHSCKPKANLQPPGRPIECETSNIVGYETKVKCCFEDNCNMGILLNLTSTPKPAGIYICCAPWQNLH